MKQKIEIGRNYRTDCGYEVVLFTTQMRNSNFSVVGEYNGPEGWTMQVWTPEGLASISGLSPHLNLVNINENHSELEQ